MSSSYESIYALIAGMGTVFYLICLAFSILLLIANWKLFTKAGEPGWAVIVPFYGAYVLFKVVYGNGWKFLLTVVPILGSIVNIALYIRMAQVYGRSAGFGVLNLFFSPITMCIMAFSDDQYQGPVDSFI